MRFSNLFSVLLICFGVSQISAHSWLTFPFPQEQYQYRYSTDSLINNSEIWGCRVPEVNNSEGNGEYPVAKISRGEDLCVNWASNGHYMDPQRGYVSLYLSSYLGNNQTLLQEDLFINEIISDIDFYNYQGIKVKIPEDFPIGEAILQWRWFYCGANEMLVSCATVNITESGDNTYGFPPEFNGLIQGQCYEGAEDFIPDEKCPKQEMCPNQLNNPDIFWKTKEHGVRSIDNLCSIDIDLELGNPYVGFVNIDNIDVKGNCPYGTAPSSPENKCYIKLSIDIENHKIGIVNMTGIFYETDCSKEFLDGVITIGLDQTEECIIKKENEVKCNSDNVPDTFCCNDNDCETFSHCKTYQKRHSNGFWRCQ